MGAALLVAWLLPGPVGGVATGPTTGPEGDASWLVAGCALAAAGCVAWLWVLVTLVVAEALRGSPGRAGVPGALRRVVLATCGLTITGALVVPAHADRATPPPESPVATRALLVGLPLPDRTTTTTQWIGTLSARPSPRVQTPADPEVVRVEPGNTLWDIACATLRPGADSDEIDRRWRAIYRANVDTVGADPDLIRPGQRLLLPPTRSHQP